MKMKRFVWGVLLLIVAVGAVFSGLGWIDLGRVSFGKAVLGLICAYGVIQGIWKVRFAELLFSLAFLAILFDRQLGLQSITPWTVLFAALIGSIGLEMIFHDRVHKQRKYFEDLEKNENKTCFDESETTDSGQRVYCKVNFGSATKYLNGESFQRAVADVNFGEAKLYLNKAILEKDTADVYTNVKFGELQIYIPRQWKVEIHRENVFCADVKEKGGKEFVENAPVINIYANVCFGDITIQYI